MARKSSVVKSNAERFIVAYNKIDYTLRTVYGFKRNISFADLVRKAVTMNSVVRKYEEELIDYGRLRNSIVHRTNPNYVIAEPHEDVVEEFEKIAKLISTPPTAIERVGKSKVLTQRADASIKETIELIYKSGFSNIPVYEGNNLIGVATGHRIIDMIGKIASEGKNVDEFLENNSIKDILLNDDARYYKVADRTITIEEALNMFYIDRKLSVILITEKGTYDELPLGIISAADILDMNEVLENY